MRGDVRLGEVLSAIRGASAADVLVVVGKVVGIGLFAALLYSYCNVLIEACIRHT